MTRYKDPYEIAHEIAQARFIQALEVAQACADAHTGALQTAYQAHLALWRVESDRLRARHALSLTTDGQPHSGAA